MNTPTRHPYIWVPDAANKSWYVDNIQPDMIDIVSIAKGLAKQCRFGGQIDYFYSVAQHSILLRNALPCEPQFKIFGLLHDAAEAYIGDMPKPIKVTLPDFNKLEDRVMQAIASKYTMYYPFPATVKEYDSRILVDEATQLFNDTPDWIQDYIDGGVEPLGINIVPWRWQVAQSAFLEMFEIDIAAYNEWIESR